MSENNSIIILFVVIVLVLIAVVRMYRSPEEPKPETFNQDSSLPEPQVPKGDDRRAPASQEAPKADDKIIADILDGITDADSDASGPNLDDQYATNLREAGPDGEIEYGKDTTYGADYNQGYSLGVSMDDAELSRFTSQAPAAKSQPISDDLLPKANEKWFETPSVGTSVQDANLLATPEFKVGMNTSGNTKRSACYDIRGNIPAPKFTTGPWNQSSYDPDTNLAGFC
jgi:hypothetical protein